MSGDLVIYGAGGQGSVVAEAAALAGWRVLGFVDDAVTRRGGPLPMLDADNAALADASWHVAIGDNAARQRVTRGLADRGRTLVSVIHPAAHVSPSASIDPGCFVGPGALVHTNARIGEGSILNSGAIIEHDDQLGSFVHIAPGAALAGRVRIGERTLVGLGARVLPELTLGTGCIIGAGAVVTRDVADGLTVRGVPARPV